MIIKNKSWSFILCVSNFQDRNFLKFQIFVGNRCCIPILQFYHSCSRCEIAERRGRRIRNLAKRKVFTNIICIDWELRNSLVFETFRNISNSWTAFDQRKTICRLSNSMESCRWKILLRFIGDDLSQFYIENAFNFKMRQFHLSPDTVIVPIVKPRMYLLYIICKWTGWSETMKLHKRLVRMGRERKVNFLNRFSLLFSLPLTFCINLLRDFIGI